MKVLVNISTSVPQDCVNSLFVKASFTRESFTFKSEAIRSRSRQTPAALPSSSTRGGELCLYLEQLPSTYRTIAQSCLSHQWGEKANLIEGCSIFQGYRGLIWTEIRQLSRLIIQCETLTFPCCCTEETQAYKVTQLWALPRCSYWVFYLCH